ncbi:ATP-dependent RNA helicase [Corynebacterium urinipleomorphum]|uniref:ATP-dependent RNA helicase n=1 Tax=Corynebacterium urinipleomorphum TaxID=1852380 RepID=UPI000B355C28|nr:ATP-dependent helicase C-terminal domain-containing protein [Corynebacterium urinipleomorphum]
MIDRFDLSTIGAGLPVSDVIGNLPARGPLVVEAPPGTGKTTLLPPAISNLTASSGITLVTAPRRVAVRAAARRLAFLDGTPLGDRVGYSIRGEHKDGSLVEFVTPGVLLNRLLKDPELTGVGAVVIDEVHERQLDTDLVLAMAMEVAFLREDLYLAAMSATLDAEALAAHMGAQILSTEAVTHPLDVSYHPHPGRAEGSREFYRHVADLAANQAPNGRDGRTLVFVPGAREVDMVCSQLPSAAPMHGRLSNVEQDEALNGKAQVVVATSIAESSITVPGVNRVVDAGLSRVPRRDAARAMTGLVTVSAAKTSADQRAGRAGRLGPGEVLRAYSQSDYQHFNADIAPEITTADLTSAALTLAAWGSPDLPLLTPPPANALADAQRTLRSLGALDDNGITALGEELAAMPLDPRLGAALLQHGSGAARTVAALAESASGDLARAHAPQRQVDRYARMVPDTAPVPPGEVIATAYPDWVGKHLGNREYLLASGTRATLDTTIPPSDWLAAAEIQLTAKGAVIRAAAATEFPANRVEESTTASLIDGRLRSRRLTSIGAIELTSTPITLSPAEAQEALAGIRIDFDDFPLDENAQRLRDRLFFLRERYGDPWPDVREGDYSPEVGELARGTSIRKLDMRAALMRQLPWPEAADMDTLAPERLTVPSGSHPRVDYSTGRPIVRVKLQECFGLSSSPEVSGVRVLFHLLSPAGRELAVTDDLASFWDGPYTEVRKEMRGRYPKHPWPEDPWSATATAKTKNRM